MSLDRVAGLRLEKRAGEAIGLTICGDVERGDMLWIGDETCEIWTPLSSLDQAMRIVLGLGLCIAHRRPQQAAKRPEWIVQNDTYSEMFECDDLNEAIIRCAAKLASVDRRHLEPGARLTGA